MSMTIEKTCDHCGISFTSIQSRTKYCCNKCYHMSLFKTRTLKNAHVWFWTKVDIRGDGECWEWQGAKCTNGYGRYNKLWGRCMILAHRLAYWITTGVEPKKLVLHSCDNRLCCNPAHLREGTHQDNANDAMARNRLPLGTKKPQSKLTPEAVAVIKGSKKPHTRLAEEHGVSEATIRDIRLGKTWKWVNQYKTS